MNMNTTTMNKDETGYTTLLAAMLVMIAAATFSSMPAVAKVSADAPVKSVAASRVDSRSTDANVETIVVTATRLK